MYMVHSTSCTSYIIQPIWSIQVFPTNTCLAPSVNELPNRDDRTKLDNSSIWPHPPIDFPLFSLQYDLLLV